MNHSLNRNISPSGTSRSLVLPRINRETQHQPKSIKPGRPSSASRYGLRVYLETSFLLCHTLLECLAGRVLNIDLPIL